MTWTRWGPSSSIGKMNIKSRKRSKEESKSPRKHQTSASLWSGGKTLPLFQSESGEIGLSFPRHKNPWSPLPFWDLSIRALGYQDTEVETLVHEPRMWALWFWGVCDDTHPRRCRCLALTLDNHWSILSAVALSEAKLSRSYLPPATCKLPWPQRLWTCVPVRFFTPSSRSQVLHMPDTWQKALEVSLLFLLEISQLTDIYLMLTLHLYFPTPLTLIL